MAVFGIALYLILAVLIAWFARRARGKSLDDLFADHHLDHHRVQRVIENHPTGGTWAQHRGWMEEVQRDR